MAEIKVEKRPVKGKGIPIWMILLGLILLAILVWAFLAGREDARPNATGNQTSSIELAAPPLAPFVPISRAA